MNTPAIEMFLIACEALGDEPHEALVVAVEALLNAVHEVR
jgi:hypothetical protein